MFIQDKSLVLLQQKANDSLHRLNIWLINNELSLNSEKTHYLIFSKDEEAVNNMQLNITIGNNQIGRQQNTKF
jgi:uncharacterized protein YjaZ